MIRDFKRDLEKARSAEQLVREVFSSLAPGYKFIDVAADRAYFYKGDIKAILPTGKEVYIEVKDDSRIAETRRILCEDENYIRDGDYYLKGNMQSDYDIYTIVSQAERKIYVLDFKKLQGIYKKGVFTIISHADQDTYCYLLDLYIAKRYGAMIDIIDY